MYKVFIEDLEFYAYHGVSSEEQKVGHRYTASVVFSVEGKAGVSDSVDDTVDYGAAADIIQRIATDRNFATMERLANEIGQELLRRFDKATQVELKIAKRLPPIPQTALEAGVEITMTR